MANSIQHLTSISPDLGSSPPPGRRLVALLLCSMLVLASVLPGVALAGEADSEGVGTVPEVEVPVPPNLDPGGEETGLEEVPLAGSEEGGTAETETEVGAEALPPEEVSGAVTEAPVEAPPPPSVSPQPASSMPDPEQQASGLSEPVANQSIVGPKQERSGHDTASESGGSGEAPASESAHQEAPAPSPQPPVSTPVDRSQRLAGKGTYVVRPGDCLWHIAASLLPGDAGTQAITEEVKRLWRLNEDRIGTGDPNLIYAGTELRLR